MKYALIIAGLLAGLAIAAPDLVLLGYVFLIMPGVILTAAPTVFVYLALTSIIRRLWRISSPAKSTTAAVCAAVLLGWVVMQPFRLAAVARYRATELPDVLPDQPIELWGKVRIERPNEYSEPKCDYLSLAVLDSPRVQSVTTITGGRSKPLKAQPIEAYSLVSAKKNPAAGIFPSEPGEIVRNYPPLLESNRGKRFRTAIKAVEAGWAIRLSGPDRLRAVAPVEADAADWILRLENPSNFHTSTLRRITILDSSGIVRFRRSYRAQAVPAPMFYLGFSANLSGGSASASFHVSRQILASGDRSLQLEPALLQAITFRVPDCDTDIVNLLRDRATQALDDPKATPVGLDLARRYLGLFWFDTKPQDQELIAKIVADDRVKDIDQQLQHLFSKNGTPSEMRDAFVARIRMEHTSADLRRHLAELLAGLPPGAFTNADAEYQAIWDSPVIYQHAAPLIATLADSDPDQALLKLDKILDTAVGLPRWSERRCIVEGIRQALIRLGPQATAAAPRIRELFLLRPSPIINNSSDADEWRFALARMGVALEDLPVFPGQSPQSVEQNRRKVFSKLQRYEQTSKAQDMPL